MGRLGTVHVIRCMYVFVLHVEFMFYVGRGDLEDWSWFGTTSEDPLSPSYGVSGPPLQHEVTSLRGVAPRRTRPGSLIRRPGGVVSVPAVSALSAPSLRLDSMSHGSLTRVPGMTKKVTLSDAPRESSNPSKFPFGPDPVSDPTFSLWTTSYRHPENSPRVGETRRPQCTIP